MTGCPPESGRCKGTRSPESLRNGVNTLWMKKRQTHKDGRTHIRPDLYLPAGHAGGRDQQDRHHPRALHHRTRRQNREDRTLGHAAPGLSRGETPRGLFRLHGRQEHAGRHHQGTGTAPESFRRRHQVSDHSPGRRTEAPAETRKASRAPCQPPSAQASPGAAPPAPQPPQQQSSRSAPPNKRRGRESISKGKGNTMSDQPAPHETPSAAPSASPSPSAPLRRHSGGEAPFEAFRRRRRA